VHSRLVAIYSRSIFFYTLQLKRCSPFDFTIQFLESATQNSKMDAPGVLQEIHFQAEAL
jgi:hypothetical protein